MAIFGRRRSSMRRQAAPVAQQRAVAAPAQRMPGAPVAPSGAAQAAAFNQSQQAAMKQFQGQQAAFNAANRAVPATPQQNVASLQAAKVAATRNVAPQQAQRTGIAPAPAQKMPGAAAAQAASVNQFNQSQQNAMQRANSMAQFNQGQQAAMQRFNAPTAALQAAQQRSNPNMSIPMETMPSAPAAQVPQAPSKAMQSYMAAEKAGTVGNMAKPAFRKGGAVKKKKTGYAKGGMAMCGASMPPAQKRKK